MVKKAQWSYLNNFRKQRQLRRFCWRHPEWIAEYICKEIVIGSPDAIAERKKSYWRNIENNKQASKSNKFNKKLPKQILKELPDWFPTELPKKLSNGFPNKFMNESMSSQKNFRMNFQNNYWTIESNCKKKSR